MFTLFLFASLLVVSAWGFDNSTVGSSTCGGKGRVSLCVYALRM